MGADTHWLYLPGLGTGTRSVKGAAVGALLARYGHTLRTLDLRVPDFSNMRVSAMLELARGALGNPDDRAVLVATSLGGYVGAQLAALDPRVCALVLYAPALELAYLRRERPFATWFWEQVAWAPVWDKTEARLRPLHVGFLREVEALGWGVPPARAPTLIVHGVHDRAVHIGSSRRYVADNPRVQLLEVADGHHLRSAMPQVLLETERFLSPWLGEPAAHPDVAVVQRLPEPPPRGAVAPP